MAEKKVYVGSVGPLLYDNAELVDDPDGDFSGETQHAFLSDGQGKITETPTEDYHVLRKIDILDLIYPVGAVYISSVGTSPATLFGGTWVAIEGSFIATYKNGDADFGVAGASGGSKTASHTNNHSGTAVADHADHVHTGPATHTEVSNAQGAAAGDIVSDGTHGNTGGSTTTLSHTVTQPDAHGDHSILPPFKVFYAWERTA